MRTYSFDQFNADKPELSTTNPGGAEQTPPAEQARPRTDEGRLHYGRQHAQTAQLYRKHRQERERAEQMRRASETPAKSEATPREAMEPRAAEPPRQDAKEQPQADQAPALKPDEAGHGGLKGLAQQAVSSVLAVAKEAAKGHPLSGARKLAGEAFSGVRRVAQQVSARTGRTVKKEQESGTKKGPGKKR
jgi:FtsZ-interacting cell division protein ZipA